MVNKTLATKLNYDPRSLLGGTNNSLGNCIKTSFSSPGFFLNSFMVLPLPHNQRNLIQNVLKDNRHPDLL